MYEKEYEAAISLLREKVTPYMEDPIKMTTLPSKELRMLVPASIDVLHSEHILHSLRYLCTVHPMNSMIGFVVQIILKQVVDAL